MLDDTGRKSMKNQEVIDKILQYHPLIPDYQGCDGYKTGDPQEEVYRDSNGAGSNGRCDTQCNKREL